MWQTQLSKIAMKINKSPKVRIMIHLISGARKCVVCATLKEALNHTLQINANNRMMFLWLPSTQLCQMPHYSAVHTIILYFALSKK